MGATTGISWTDHTFNPWMGCQRVSPGCERCYAEALVTGRMGLPVWGPPSTTPRKRTTDAYWRQLAKWDREAERDGVRRRVFIASLADVFEAHPMVEPWRVELCERVEPLRWLDIQFLTKRIENVQKMVPAAWLRAWPKHVWIGCTVEDQQRAEERIPWLVEIPAAVRFLSLEPLLGPVDLTNVRPYYTRRDPHPFDPAILFDCLRGRMKGPDELMPDHRVQWVIVGGESGPGARDYQPPWARSILRQCAAAGVAAFHKQFGARPMHPLAPSGAPDDGGDLVPIVLRDRRHGADWTEWPDDLRVREFPRVEA